MSPILTLALKDLRLLLRVRSGWFFTFVWPLVVATFFGLIFSGGGSAGSRVRVSLVDEDRTERSRRFVERLSGLTELDAVVTSLDEATRAVRLGRRSAAVVVESGFGEASERMFYGAPPAVRIVSDPSRTAEAGMLEGLLMREAVHALQTLLGDGESARRMIRNGLQDLDRAPDDVAPLRRFLGDLDRFLESRPASPSGLGMSWQPLAVKTESVVAERRGPQNAFEVTFPQGALWGVIGCVMTFVVGFVSERTQGTWLRLRAAPLSRANLVVGKALGCFLAIACVQAALFTLGRLVFGVRPTSLGLLVLAGASVAICFVGIMMLIASLGRTEQAAGGWAVLMPLSMLGGGMVPLFVMPPWMATLSYLSPVRWALQAFEGALWRRYTIGEMLAPCAALVIVGSLALLGGVRALRSREEP